MIEKDKINIGVLGAGVVGSNVLGHYYSSKSQLEQTAGQQIEILQVAVKDPYKPRSIGEDSQKVTLPIPPEVITTSIHDVTDSSGINVVVSLLGDEEAERYAIGRALSRGKFVVTANKLVIAKHGPELFEIAARNRTGLLFEAAVGGGIQVVDNLIDRYSPNKITAVLGILNGTTNYILTEMRDKKIDFGTALEAAQELGYAEPDPTNDVEGHDAAYKTAILATLAFRKGWVDPAKVYREGITKIESQDFEDARKLGYTIKLVGTALDTQEGVEAWVAPVFVRQNHPLASVNGVTNSILLRGIPIGDTQLSGRGAGGEPTSASIWSDVLKAGSHIRRNSIPQDGLFQEEARVIPFEECQHRIFVKATIVDGFRRIEHIGKIASDNLVSINDVKQLLNDDFTDRKHRDEENNFDLAEIGIELDPSGEGNVGKTIEAYAQSGFFHGISSRYRIVA